MSSLMTSPNSSAPESAWSENQVKKLSGSSCCRFLPALLGVWLDRLVRSCKRRKDPNSDVFNRWTEFRHRANNSFILFLVSIWSLLTSRLGLHFHSGEFLWRGLCSQNTCFHRNTKMQQKRDCELWKHKKLKAMKIYFYHLQNLFCSQIWCLQTLSLLLWSDSEAPPHPPPQEERRLNNQIIFN